MLPTHLGEVYHPIYASLPTVCRYPGYPPVYHTHHVPHVGPSLYTVRVAESAVLSGGPQVRGSPLRMVQKREKGRFPGSYERFNRGLWPVLSLIVRFELKEVLKVLSRLFPPEKGFPGL